MNIPEIKQPSGPYIPGHTRRKILLANGYWSVFRGNQGTWRFSLSKRRWPNELAQVGWFGRQKSARMISPGKVEGKGRWQRGTMLRMTIAVQTPLHLRMESFQVSVCCGQPQFWLPLHYLPGHLCQWWQTSCPPLSEMLCTLLKPFCSLWYIFTFSFISSRGPGARTPPFTA